MKRASVGDVARTAGVSTATVSRVINAPDRVSEITRSKVLAAIDELNFVKNATALSLKAQQTNNILVITDNVGSLYYSEVFDGLLREAEAQGYSILISKPSTSNVSRQITNRLRSGAVDGVIVLDGFDLSDSDLELLKSSFPGVPPVVGFAEKPNYLHYPHVYINNHRAAFVATQHLIDAGHTKIGHIMAPKESPASEERLAGYREAMLSAGLVATSKDIYPGGFHRDFGRRTARDLARRTDRPTAMFCSNDEVAMGLISELAILGINVPDEISVVGFDNVTAADVYIPALTTISQPRAEIGARTMALMLDVLRDPEHIEKQVVELEVRLAKRASVARPAPQQISSRTGANKH